MVVSYIRKVKQAPITYILQLCRSFQLISTLEIPLSISLRPGLLHSMALVTSYAAQEVDMEKINDLYFIHPHLM